MFAAFKLAAPPSRPYEFRDRIMAYYGPIALVLLPAWWLVLLALGFALIYWALGDAPRRRDRSPAARRCSRSASCGRRRRFGEIVAFVEAAIGLALVALLISYLPTIYSAFSRRELLVNLLEVRADSPPSPVVMITRMHRLSGLDAMHDLWERWEQWFAEVEETHSSLPVLVFYRSQQHDHSWVNAAGAVMDAAALMRSAVAAPWDVQADLTIRAGYLALRRIATYFRIDVRPAPRPDGRHQHRPGAVRPRPSTCSAASGVPLVEDRDQAWRDFNGWRVNYDAVLRGLEKLTMAPTPWWDRPMHSAWETDEPAARRGRRARRRRDTAAGRGDPGGGYPASLNRRTPATSPAVMISATITPRTPTPHIGQSIGPSASLAVGVVVVAVVAAVIGRGPVAALDGVGRAVLVADRVLVVGVGHRGSLPPCAAHCPTREP